MAPPTKRERAAEARASSSKPGAALPPPGGAADGERRRMDQPPNFLLRLPRLLPAHHPPDPTLQIASATLPALFDITDPKLFPAPSTQDHHQQLRVPCRAGICTTPIQITSSQLVSNEIFPPAVVKAMLYPGAIVSNLTTSMSMTFPRWSDLFDIYNLIEAKNASAVIDLKRLEMIAGSYFCVAGALVGIINPGRMILFGTLLVIWGLVKDALFRKPVDSELTEPVYVYPTILIALICSFMSITYNIKKKARSSQSVSISKPLQSSAKSKLK